MNLAQQHNFQQIEGANKQGKKKSHSHFSPLNRPLGDVGFVVFRRRVMWLDGFPAGCWAVPQVENAMFFLVLDLLAMMHEKANHKKIGK